MHAGPDVVAEVEVLGGYLKDEKKRQDCALGAHRTTARWRTALPPIAPAPGSAGFGSRPAPSRRTRHWSRATEHRSGGTHRDRAGCRAHQIDLLLRHPRRARRAPRRAGRGRPSCRAARSVRAGRKSDVMWKRPVAGLGGRSPARALGLDLRKLGDEDVRLLAIERDAAGRHGLGLSAAAAALPGAAPRRAPVAPPGSRRPASEAAFPADTLAPSATSTATTSPADRERHRRLLGKTHDADGDRPVRPTARTNSRAATPASPMPVANTARAR